MFMTIKSLYKIYKTAKHLKRKGSFLIQLNLIIKSQSNMSNQMLSVISVYINVKYKKLILSFFFFFFNHCLCVCASGDRAEGAEATLEAGLNNLSLNVAQKAEGDSGG